MSSVPRRVQRPASTHLFVQDAVGLQAVLHYGCNYLERDDGWDRSLRWSFYSGPEISGRLVEVRTAMDENAPGAVASFDKASIYFAPNYRFSTHTAAFHIPVGTRRGVGAPAHDFYRESFMDELAHAAGKDPYLYRRELISRSRLPYKSDMINALDPTLEARRPDPGAAGASHAVDCGCHHRRGRAIVPGPRPTAA